MRYPTPPEKIASRTVADEYFAVTDKVVAATARHLYTASWAKALALPVHLGFGMHLQRCLVDHRWRIASRVSANELSEEQLAEARRHPF